jgi:excisionase family DNA binding protein
MEAPTTANLPGDERMTGENDSIAEKNAAGESYLTVREAAALLKCSSQSVARLVQTGRLPGVDVGTGTHRSYRIKASDIDTFLAVKPPPPKARRQRPRAIVIPRLV